MVLRDTLVYKASMRNFQVVSVARPRQPVLVGSCVSTDGVLFGLVVQDTFAYEVSAFGLWIVNVARPDSPFVVSSTQDRLTAAGLAVRDTFAYIPNSHETLWVYSVADPTAPRPLAALPLRSRGYDIVLADTLAWVGEVSGMEVLSIADPVRPRSVAFAPSPYLVRRLAYQAPHLYAAMFEAGVAVYDSVLTFIAEQPAATMQPGQVLVAAQPSVVGTKALVMVQCAEYVRLMTYDASGRALPGRVAPQGEGRFLLDLRSDPGGIYFLRACARMQEQAVKIVRE
jgi:hypothetical protein